MIGDFKITMLDGTEVEAASRQSDAIAFERHFSMPFVKMTLETAEINGEQQSVFRLEHMWYLAYRAWRRAVGGDSPPSFDDWCELVDEVNVTEVTDPDPKA